MTIEIGDTGFAALMEDLRRQIDLLKQRCIAAETEVTQLKQSQQVQQERIAELEQTNRELTDRYNNLQAGTASGTSAEEIESLRNRYLAMIREIDLCLSKLNG